MYYTYISYERNNPTKKYIGYHSLKKGTVAELDGYYGQYKDSSFNPDAKVILGYFENIADAKQAEYTLQVLFDVEKNNEFVNKRIHPPNFYKNSEDTGRKLNYIHTKTGEEILQKTPREFRKITGLLKSDVSKFTRGILRTCGGWELAF